MENFYKIIVDNKIIGVGTDFFKYKKENNLSLITDKANCQYVIYKFEKYHDAWMQLPPSGLKITQALVEDIDAEEYKALFASLQQNENIEIEEIEYAPKIEVIEENDYTLDFVKESKINEFRALTEKEITKGVDVNGSHYSFTIQDQLNMMTILQEKEGLYHADGEDMKIFTKDQIMEIYNKQQLHKNLYTSYYISARNYINSLTSLKMIAELEYGIDIPDEFKTETYKSLKEEYGNV